MCGIVGYVGEKQAAPILLDGLSKLEYRGHDGQTMPGTIGIGHTRWATHGEPSDVNAHPHYNKNKNIVVVHNGIIENYLKLKQKLEKKGYEFVSEPDTELLLSGKPSAGDYKGNASSRRVLRTWDHVPGSSG